MNSLRKNRYWQGFILGLALAAWMAPPLSFGQGDSVDAQVAPGGTTIVVSQGEEEAPAIQQDVPLDQFKPAIPPDPASINRTSSGPNLPVTFDPATGMETIGEDAGMFALPEKNWVDSDPGFAPSGKALDPSSDGIGLLNFNNISRVSDTTEFPWRANCKLYITFRATDDTVINLVGTGTLIGQKYVLTAGHNVYRHSYLTKTINAWAESIKIVPACSNNNEPYGSAQISTMHSWTGWTTDANYDHDLGLIRLDRPLGVLTGFYGYGYDNCTFMTGNTLGMAGYPAGFPADGSCMANWSGSFDACSGSVATMNKAALYGLDGANFYHNPSAGVYTSYGVMSLQMLNSTECAMITSAKHTNITDILASSYPATYDLQPMIVRSNVEYYAPGEVVNSPTMRVLNYSSETYDGIVGYSVRLSTNDIISDADRNISNQQFSWNFAPHASVAVNLVQPTIPADTPPGVYYVGVLLNNADASTSNNDSSGQDAMKITVSPAGAPTALPIINGFVSGADGWTAVNSIPPFDAALSVDTGDHLGLSPNGSALSFAFWSSPQITLVRGKSYRAFFAVKTSETNPDNALCFRMRCNQASSNRSWVANCDSVQGTSPTDTVTKFYVLDFVPEFTDPTEKVSFGFDMMSFNPFDNLMGWVYLEGFILVEYPI